EELGERCHALTCVSETMARSEAEEARRLGGELGLGPRHHVVESNELARDDFADNPRHRCALCKTELMEIAGPLAARLGVGVIALGTVTDDLGDDRPGIEAAGSRGAVSPLLEADMGKADVRALSRALGLRTWNKPQLACLSSRFPYGTAITPERLRRVDRFEEGLRVLGFGQLRVRSTNRRRRWYRSASTRRDRRPHLARPRSVRSLGHRRARRHRRASSELAGQQE